VSIAGGRRFFIRTGLGMAIRARSGLARLLALRLATDFTPAHRRDENVTGDSEISGWQGSDTIADLDGDALYRAGRGATDALHPANHPAARVADDGAGVYRGRLCWRQAPLNG
jgi:hypothetical protein